MADAIMFPAMIDVDSLNLPFKTVSTTKTFSANAIRIGSLGGSNSTICQTSFMNLPPSIGAGVSVSTADVYGVPTANCDYMKIKWNITLSDGSVLTESLDLKQVEMRKHTLIDSFSTSFMPPSGSTWYLDIELYGTTYWGDARPGQDAPVDVTTGTITAKVSYIILNI